MPRSAIDGVSRFGVVRPRGGGFGLVLALMAAAAFGTSGSMVTAMVEAGWSTGAVVVGRIGIAGLVLAIPAAMQLRGRWAAVRSSWRLVVVFGLLAVAGCQWFYFNAVEHLTVGVALMLEYLGTVLVVGWLWLRHGQRPRRLTAVGTVVAIGGLVLVLNLIGGARLDLVGVMWGLGAAVGLAVFFVLAAKTNDDLPPLALSCGGLLVGTAGLLVLGGVGAVRLRVSTADVVLAGRPLPWWVPVLEISLVAAAFAYIAGIGATRLLGAKLASFVGLTEVLFAVLFAWLLLGQLPTGIQLVGGVLVVAGVALVRMDEMQSPMLRGRARESAAPATAGPAATDATATPTAATGTATATTTTTT
jgi:drug/metabolite transporter (DMT)-like permease